MSTTPTHHDPDADGDPLFSGSDEELTYDHSGDHSSREHSPQPDDDEHEPADDDDVEQDEPPSQLRRTTWILIILSSFILAFLAQTLLVKREPEIVYATRYSKEHKFRPAASPIITETLKDGRIRLRGATPPPVSKPVKTATPQKKKKPAAGKAGGKKAKAKKKPGTSARQ